MRIARRWIADFDGLRGLRGYPRDGSRILMDYEDYADSAEEKSRIYHGLMDCTDWDLPAHKLREIPKSVLNP